MGFEVIDIQKMQKNLLASFFFAFLNHHFSNTIPGGVALGLALPEI